MKRKRSIRKEVKKIVSKIDGKQISYLLLSLMILIYIYIFSRLNILIHDKFGTSGFDLGVQDQGMWLISRGKTPFVTVRGLHLFGDHVTFIHVLLAPLYWIWDNVRVILIAQSVLLGLGAIPIYLLANDKFKNTWIPLAFVFSYLFYTPLHYLNLWQFHPDALVVPFFLFAFYFFTKKKYHLYFLFISLVLLCKEEISLTVIALGIYLTIISSKFKIKTKTRFWRNFKISFDKELRNIGLMTITIGIIWLIFALKIVLPYFNGFGYFRHLYGYGVFGKLGENPEEIINTFIFEPEIVSSVLFTETNGEYISNLLFPVSFSSLLGSPLIIAIPSLLTNTLSGYYYTHSIKYHYTAAIIPFIFVSAIYGLSRLKRNFRIFGIILIIITSLSANWYMGPYFATMKNYDLIIFLLNKSPSNREMIVRWTMDLIPENASVSTTPFFVPQLTHREIIYEFPNPFKISYWGINGENPPPKDVDYILVDKNSISEELLSLTNSLSEKNYTIIVDYYNITLLEKN